MKRRSADPYRDLDVIDARAPRFNQLVIGSLALTAFLVEWWPLYAMSRFSSLCPSADGNVSLLLAG